MLHKISRILTKIRETAEASQRIGLKAAFRLAALRLGSADRVYEIKVPQWPKPVYVRGGKSSDLIVLHELFVLDEYAPVQLSVPPRAIIDAGANIGLTSAYFLERYPTARIISVEPFPQTFDICQKNLACFPDRATALLGAVWSHAGRVNLQPFPGQDWMNRVSDGADGEKGTVEAFTMKSLIDRLGGSLDLLKMDIEGGEKEIFGPGSEEWLPSVRNIVIELHGQECRDQFFQALAPYEYEQSNVESVYFCRNLRMRSAPVA